MANVAYNTLATKETYLNTDDFFFFFFNLSTPTVPFILGRLGIPIFGNQAIPRWLWHSPDDHFILFLSQAENDLPPHGQRLTGTEPGPLIEGRTCWTPCRSGSHRLFFSVCLPPSYRLYLEILSPIPSLWSLICYLFSPPSLTPHCFCPSSPLALPPFLSRCFNWSPVIQAFLQRMP